MQQFYVWEDSFDDLLYNELEHKKFNINLLRYEDWLYILQHRSIDLFKKQDLAISIFVTSKLKLQDYVNLLAIFANLSQVDDEQPQAGAEGVRIELIEQIDRDVGRTFKKGAFFKEQVNQQRLKRILLDYASYDPEVGYAQGMNFLAATLLHFEVPNADAMFRKIMSSYRGNYTAGTPQLFENLARLQYKIKKRLPKLYDHFRKFGLKDLSICFSHHYLTLLVQNCPYQFQLIILSMYLLQGIQVIHRLMVGMLDLSQHILLEIGDMQKLSDYIRTGLIIAFFKALQSSRKEWMFLKMLSAMRLVKRIKLQQSQP